MDSLLSLHVVDLFIDMRGHFESLGHLVLLVRRLRGHHLQLLKITQRVVHRGLGLAKVPRGRLEHLVGLGSPLHLARDAADVVDVYLHALGEPPLRLGEEIFGRSAGCGRHEEILSSKNLRLVLSSTTMDVPTYGLILVS